MRTDTVGSGVTPLNGTTILVVCASMYIMSQVCKSMKEIIFVVELVYISLSESAFCFLSYLKASTCVCS